MSLASASRHRERTAPPLDGVRVLDFTHIVAGPFCTRILADLGAEVLHVETRSRTEGMGVHAGRQERRDARVHRNKKSITLNLKHERGQAIAARLASVADVLVENFSSGVMRRLHLDYESLRPSNPSLIYVSMSGFGHTGPRRDWTSMNMNLQGYSGLMLVTGSEGDPPTSVSNSWNDFIGGLHASFGILQVLMERQANGSGMYLDLSQAECSISTLGPLVLCGAANGENAPRLGNRSTSAAPQGCYPCAGGDEWCVISVQTNEQWTALCQLIGASEFGRDPRFASFTGRLRYHDEIDQKIRSWAVDLPKQEVEARLTAAGIPGERVRHADEVVESDDAGLGFHPLRAPGFEKPDLTALLPFTLSVSQRVPPISPATTGQHTHEALSDWLGLTADAIDDLERAGALV
ncbi:MAG TPA: CoA transferase [Chloroflexota bacterium]|nr:CoA transferase [Chloroflexota bacterium]